MPAGGESGGVRPNPRSRTRQPQGGGTVLCSVFRAPREYNGEEDSEYSGMRGVQEYVFRF